MEGIGQVPRQKSRQDASAAREKAARRGKWHRHSCLCAFARPGIHSLANPVASLALDFPWPPWRLIANDNPTRIVILSDQRESKGLRSQSLPLLIANLELEFSASRRKQSLGLKSNRKYFAIFYLAFSACEGGRNLTRRSSVTEMGLGRVPQMNRTGRSVCATKDQCTGFSSLVTRHPSLS